MAMKRIINKRTTGRLLHLKDPASGKPVSKMLLGTYHNRRGAKKNWSTHQGVLLVDEKEISHSVALQAHYGYLTIEPYTEEK
jgi:hypothetical protein